MDKEIRTPNDNKQVNQSNLFNDQFSSYLIKSGWTNRDIQNDFIGLINSIVLSAKDLNSQRMMVSYVKKGLDILNVELQKIDVTDKKNVVNPNSTTSDDETSTEVQTEGVTASTQSQINQGVDKKKLKELASRVKNNLKKKGFTEDKIEKVIKVVFSTDDVSDKNPKMLLDIFEERCNKLDELNSEKKVFNEEDKPEEAPKKKKEEPKKDNPKPSTDTVEKKPEPKKEKPKSPESPVNQPTDAQSNSDVTLSTFETFFKNYTVEEQSWSPEVTEQFSSVMINFVKKGSSDKNVQNKLSSELSQITSKFRSALGGEVNKEEPSTNFSTAKNELRKYAVIFNGWTDSVFENIFSNFTFLIENASVSKTQRFVLEKLQNILNNF
jgi:hypothetical protein